MSTFRVEKPVSALPATLTANTIYLVRVGAGFDIFVSDSTGTVTYSQNIPEPEPASVILHKSADYTANQDEHILADTSSAAFTLTLPATPSTGDIVTVSDESDNWETNNLTIDRNGSTIEDVAEDLVCDFSGVTISLIYSIDTWVVLASAVAGNATSGVAKLDAAQNFSAAQGVNIVDLTDQAVIATDALLSNVFAVTIAGNRTLANPSNIVAGRTYVWIVSQDATGGRSLAFGSHLKFPGNTAPTLSTAPNVTDVIIGIAVSPTKIICIANLEYS